MSERVKVTRGSDLAEGALLRVEHAGRAVALARVGGQVYAVQDRCTHEEASLAEGFLDEDEHSIECPRHGAQFDLRDGRALSLPAVQGLQTFEVEEREGDVFLIIPSEQGESHE